MARDVRINNNQLVLVMGKRDMKKAADALRELCDILNPPAIIRQLSYELNCATERFGHTATTNTNGGLDND